MKFKINDIDDYQNRLTPEQKEILIKHSNTTQVPPVICAWYDDLNDFYSDWCDEIGYSKKEANAKLKDSFNEFIIFSDNSIIRLVV